LDNHQGRVCARAAPFSFAVAYHKPHARRDLLTLENSTTFGAEYADRFGLFLCRPALLSGGVKRFFPGIIFPTGMDE